MERSKSKYLMIGVVALICIVLFGLGGDYLRKQNKPSLLPATALAETVNPTTEWKTYTNTKSSFSLKYPSDYFTYQGDPTLGFFLATAAPKGGNGPKFLGENDVWLDASSSNTAITTVDQYVNSRQSLYKDGQKKSIMIDGVPAYKIIYSYEAFPTENSSTTIYTSDGLVVKNGILYRTSLSSYKQNLVDSQQPLLEQILSTFKSFVPVTSIDTTSWKTYTNTQYGYSIKYPSQIIANQNGNFSFQNGEYVMGIVSSTQPETQLHTLNDANIDKVIANMCPNWTGMKSCSEPQSGPIPNSIQFDALNRHFVSTDTIVKNGNVIYDFSLGAVNPNKPISAEAKQIYNQVLSTLKFITQATTAATPSAVTYEKYFFPNNAKSDYKGYDYIRFDDQKKVFVFNNGNIYFEYEPNKYILSYQILNNPPEGPKEKQTQIINLEDINNKYRLKIELHMYGIGGGCSDFPKGYEMVSTILDNKNIFKAKFIDEKTANLNWPLGKIYLVDKGQYGWNCPNIAGLSSVKNGSVDIQYDLSLFGRNYNSQDYNSAEKNLDKIVSTIRNFWQ